MCVSVGMSEHNGLFPSKIFLREILKKIKSYDLPFTVIENSNLIQVCLYLVFPIGSQSIMVIGCSDEETGKH